MANFPYLELRRRFSNKEIDWDTDTVKVALVKTGSTAGSERAVTSLAGFTSLARYDGAGYADQAVSGRAIVTNVGANRIELVAGNTVFAALGGLVAPNEAIGAIYYLELGASDAQRVPLVFFDTGFPFNGSGSDITLRPAAAGLIQL